MKRDIGIQAILGLAVAVAMSTVTSFVRAETPLAIDAARVTITGTSNIHPYTASTSTVRITRVQLADSTRTGDVWTGALKTGGVEAFELSIPAATLTSPREGLDKNMYKALQVEAHPDIAFRLLRIEPGAGTDEALKGVGVLNIAGAEREVTLDLKTSRNGARLCVRGEVRILMTDFGIKPPTAMLGMLKTDPKVTVTFEITLTAPLT